MMGGAVRCGTLRCPGRVASRSVAGGLLVISGCRAAASDGSSVLRLPAPLLGPQGSPGRPGLLKGRAPSQGVRGGAQ